MGNCFPTISRNVRGQSLNGARHPEIYARETVYDSFVAQWRGDGNVREGGDH